MSVSWLKHELNWNVRIRCLSDLRLKSVLSYSRIVCRNATKSQICARPLQATWTNLLTYSVYSGQLSLLPLAGRGNIVVAMECSASAADWGNSMSADYTAGRRYPLAQWMVAQRTNSYQSVIPSCRLQRGLQVLYECNARNLQHKCI